MRVGNAAADQFQLDVWGEVLDGLHLAPRGRAAATDDRAWDLQRALLDFLEGALAEPGQRPVGGARRRAALRALQGDGLGRRRPGGRRRSSSSACDGPVDRWRALRERDPRRGLRQAASTPTANTFTQSYGSRELDAALLLIPRVGLPAAGTTRGSSAPSTPSQRELCHDGFVLRYRPDADGGVDGLPGGEGAFLRLLASGWSTPCTGSAAHDEAAALFERLLGAAQRRRPARRGVRPARRPAGRQHPAGLQPRRAGQHRPPPQGTRRAERRTNSPRREH